MPTTTANMLLTKWPSGTDYFAHPELAGDFELIDGHDHSSGKGVQIPTSGLANLAVTTAKLANGSATKVKLGADVDYESAFSTWKTFIVRSKDPVAGLGLITPRLIDVPFYFDPADLGAGTRATALRIRATVFCNATSSAIATLTAGLHAVTASGGGAGSLAYTIDTVPVTGSAASVSPAVNTRLQAVSSAFTPPAAGWYGLAVMPSQTQAINSAFGITLHLSYQQT